MHGCRRNCRISLSVSVLDAIACHPRVCQRANVPTFLLTAADLHLAWGKRKISQHPLRGQCVSLPARDLFYSSVRDHVYDIFIERGASLESDYDMTVRKCHRRPRILQTASCVCIGGASAVGPQGNAHASLCVVAACVPPLLSVEFL